MATEEKSTELVEVIETSGLESQTANTLKEKFLPYFEQAEDWKSKAAQLVVTDVSQVREMQMARQARLALRDIRVQADKTRKALKEDSLRYGKAVQGVYNVIEYLIVPIEKHLEEQEKFAEIQEAKRKAELKEQREAELQPYSEFVPLGLNLGNMSEDDFQKTLNGAKLQLEARIESERKAEAERIAKEKAEAAERERIRKENEALKQAAIEREKAIEAERIEAEKKRKAAEETARKEREKIEAERRIIEEQARKERDVAEARFRAEREAKAKLEAQIKAKADAEAKAKREAEEKAAAELRARQLAEKKAKAAPDKAKLIELALAIGSIELPGMKTAEGQKVLEDTKTLLKRVTAFIKEKSATL